MTPDTVIYIGGFILPDKNAAAHRVLANAKILNELGYRVILIGTSREPGVSALTKLEYTHPNIELYEIPYPKNIKKWVAYLWDANYIKPFLSQSVMAVVFYNYPSIALLRISSVLKAKGIKSVADCTEWYGSPEGGLIKKSIKNFDTFLRMQWINKYHVNGIITISTFLSKFYFNQKTIQLPPLIDKTASKWINQLNQAAFLSDDTIRLIYAGQPGNKDRIEDIVEIISGLINSIHRKVKLTIIGLTKEQFKDDSIPGLSNFVDFLGRVSHSEALSKIKSSDFVIFLRQNNRANLAGFPTKFVEAIGCGTPVITNKSSNLADYLIDGVNGFFLPDTKSDQRLQLRKILEMNKQDILNMKLTCLSDDQFDYKNYISDFTSFLNSLQNEKD